MSEVRSYWFALKFSSFLKLLKIVLHAIDCSNLTKSYWKNPWYTLLSWSKFQSSFLCLFKILRNWRSSICLQWNFRGCQWTALMFENIFWIILIDCYAACDFEINRVPGNCFAAWGEILLICIKIFWFCKTCEHSFSCYWLQ